MNEIEKLYANAGFIKTKGNCDVCYLDVGTCMRGYSKCPYIYPPFTPEKQLELIKWIAENKEECRIICEKEYKWCTQTDWQSSFYYDNFPISLANLINSLWQDLTEEEKEQIRNTLER